MHWWVFILPVLLPLYVIRVHLGPLPSTLLELVLLLFFVSWFWVRRMEGVRCASQRLRVWRWPLSAWVLITLAAVFWSPSVWTGLGLWRAYVLEPLLMFCVLFDLIQDEKDIRVLQTGLWALSMWVAAWALIQFVTGLGIPHPWNAAIAFGRRATGPFPFPNAVALLLAPIGAYAFSVWKRDRDLVPLMACVSAVAGIACAKSVGGTLGLVDGIWIVLVSDRRWRIPVFVTTGLVGLVAWIVPSIHRVLAKQFLFQNWSGQVRLMIWRETWVMLRDHWFTGAGFGGYPVVFKAYHHIKAIEIFQFPHNILLNTWSETGIVGVFVFVWIVWTWIVQAKHAEKDWLARLAPLAAILVHGLVDVPYFKNDLAIVFWMLIFLTCTPLDKKREGERAE